jgi:hypothetical protein
VIFAVLKADCSDVLYSTYLGGNASDLGRICLLSNAEEMLLLGTTASMDFPVTSGSYQTENDGSGLVFITKFVTGNYTFLHKGWNFISIPLLQDNTNPDIVLASIEGSYDAMQWYRVNDEEDLWKHYHKLKNPSLNDLNNLNHKMGFWIHIISPSGVIFDCSGTPLSTGEFIKLYPGWNMVGYPSNSVVNRSEGLNNLIYGTHVDTIQWYSANSDTWHFMGPDDEFVPGRGYWIHTKYVLWWEVPL